MTSWPGRVPRDRLSEAHMEKYESIMNKMRDTLITRGVRGFLGLNRILRVMDDDYDGYVNFYEFSKGKNPKLKNKPSTTPDSISLTKRCI